MKKLLQNTTKFLLATLLLVGSTAFAQVVPANLHHLLVTNGTGYLTWDNQGNTLVAPTYGQGAVILNNFLYILGGTNNTRVHRTQLSLTQTGITQSWNTADLLPMGTQYFHSAVTDGTHIYILGGNNGGATLNTLYYTTPAADGTIISWTQNSTFLPSFSQQQQSFIANGYLYIAGGQSSPSGQPKDTIYVGKINNNGSISNFSQTTSLPIGLTDQRMIVIGNRVYVTGGYATYNGLGAPLALVFSTEILQDGTLMAPWRFETALPKELYRHSLAFFGNRLYVLGGLDRTGKEQKTVYSTTIGTNGEITSWNEDPTPLPYAVAYHQTIQHNGKIYLLGGRTDQGPTSAVYFGQSLIPNQQTENFFPITVTGMDSAGQIVTDYRINTNLDVYRQGSSFFISPTLFPVANFRNGSATDSVKVWPAGSDVKILAKQQGSFGVAGESNAFSILNPNPTIGAVSPNKGFNNQTNTITITGGNFYADGSTLPTIQLGPILLSNIQFTSNTTITAQVPKDITAGKFDIVITNPDGKIGTFSNAYEVLDAGASATFVINANDYATNNRNVTLRMNVQNPPNATISLMRFSNDNIHFSDWEPFTELKQWQLEKGSDGARVVSVQFKDTLGNESGLYSDTIIYDNTPPTVNYDNIHQLPDSPQDSPTIEGSVTDTTAGIDFILWEVWKTDGYQLLGEQPVTAGIAQYFNPTMHFTVPVTLAPGMYRVHVKAYDRAGNQGDNIDHPMVFTVTGQGTKSPRTLGSITGVFTNQNIGVGGVAVYVYSAYDQGTLLRVTKTSYDILGYYQVDELPTGLYKVSFRGGGLNQEWYYGYTNSFNNAKIVEVTAPYNSDNINFELTHAIPTYPTTVPSGTAVITATPTVTNTPQSTVTSILSATPTTSSTGKVITINNDEPSTGNRNVTLRFNPPMTNAWTKLYLSNNNINFTQMNYMAVNSSWFLEVGAGEKTTYVVFEDALGNQSATFSDSIYLTSDASLTPTATAQPATNQFTAEYYNNSMLFGAPVLTRNEERIDYNWALSSPLYPLYSDSGDYFSIRWTGNFTFAESGYYRFNATCDDGCRLFIDGKLNIDKWQLQPASTYSALAYLTSGSHEIKLEYFDYTDLAQAKLTWEYTSNTLPNQFYAQYYDNPYLIGTPVFTRYDNEINFDWGMTSPLRPYLPAADDNFSARWIGDITIGTSGNYTFKTTCDDGCRLWIDDALVIDDWKPQSATTITKSVFLPSGTHNVWMEYQEYGGRATARLEWFSSG